jgi:hypothetical protein
MAAREARLEPMTREELIARTRQLADEGDRLQADPSMGRLRLWLQLSDDLLAAAWGSMDRYHLAWLMVGKPTDVVRGRPMTPDEEAAYVREVAAQKTAALRMSLDAVERQGMPFRGEDAGLAPGQGMGEVPATPAGAEAMEAGDPEAGHDEAGMPDLRRSLPLDPALSERLAEARRRAAEHEGHDVRRAPRPERMQR